tara:strand:- start:3309 stop:3773 length:465 start_codon:yes stop_codon:yes gene_type:complete
MHPEVWGPHAWIFLHSITLNYPENPSELQKQKYKEFFNILQYVIPCEKCAYNYGLKLKKNPVNLDSKSDLIEWLIDIHNDVNISNGKKPITRDEFIKIYKDIYTKPKNKEIQNSKKENKNSKKENKNFIFNNKNILTILLVFIIIIMIMSLKKK